MATQREQSILVFDEKRRKRLLRQNTFLAFPNNLNPSDPNQWEVRNSATIVDFGTFTLSNVASSEIFQQLSTGNFPDETPFEYELRGEFRIQSMDVGVAPFPLIVRYEDGLSGPTDVTLTLPVGRWLPVSLVFQIDQLASSEIRFTTGDAAKAATIQVQHLEVVRLTSQNIP